MPALGSSSTIAHEIGHMLGLKDTYPGTFINGEPNPRRSDANNFGNRVGLGHIHFTPPLELTSKDPSYIDFMGSVGGAWIDRVTWDYLYNTKFRSSSGSTKIAASKNSLESFIAVSGVITKTDSVIPNPFLLLTQVPKISQSQNGDYSIEFLNSSGSSLYTFNFPIDFIMPDEGEVSETPFSYYLPLPEGTTKFLMKKNGGEIASRNFSTNAPVVQLISPQSGETISGMKTVQWTANDIDGDKLTYDLLYSLDGKVQNILAVNLEDTSYVWESNLYPYSASASLTVIANDGINEGKFTADHLFLDSPVGIDQEEKLMPKEYSLQQNYPNPFNPSTTINFQIPTAGIVLLKVYDILGKEVATLVNEEKTTGNYQVSFDASFLSNGIYFYRLQASDFIQTKKMILIK